MTITSKLLDDLKKKLEVSSDYALAKRLGISVQRISNYRTGRNHFDDLMAYRVAQLLDLDPAELVAQINLERAKRPEEKAAWREILKQLGDAAAVVLLGLSLASPQPAPAMPSGGDTTPRYTLCELRRRRWFDLLLDLLQPF